MITNERQFRISKAQLEKMRNVVAAFNVHNTAKRSGSLVLAQAELAALQSQVDELQEQIREYETLQSGGAKVLRADSLSDLPRILIKARIAQGLSQRALAELLGLKEQQIQRYESEEYSTASLRRLAAVARALNLNISEVAALSHGKPADRKAETERVKQDRFRGR